LKKPELIQKRLYSLPSIHEPSRLKVIILEPFQLADGTPMGETENFSLSIPVCEPNNPNTERHA
jgi:hypothetical protein